MCGMGAGADPATLCSSKEAVPRGDGAMGLDGDRFSFQQPLSPLGSSPAWPPPLPPPGFEAAFAWGMQGGGRQRGADVKPVHASTAPTGSQCLPSSPVRPSTSWSCLKAAAGTGLWLKVQGPPCPCSLGTSWLQAAAFTLCVPTHSAAHRPLPKARGTPGTPGEGCLETPEMPWQPGAGPGGMMAPTQWRAGTCHFLPVFVRSLPSSFCPASCLFLL